MCCKEHSHSISLTSSDGFTSSACETPDWQAPLVLGPTHPPAPFPTLPWASHPLSCSSESDLAHCPLSHCHASAYAILCPRDLPFYVPQANSQATFQKWWTPSSVSLQHFSVLIIQFCKINPFSTFCMPGAFFHNCLFPPNYEISWGQKLYYIVLCNSESFPSCKVIFIQFQ